MMDLGELAKKHCYNGHNPEQCELLADLRALVADERDRAAAYLESAGNACGDQMVAAKVILDLADAIRKGI